MKRQSRNNVEDIFVSAILVVSDEEGQAAKYIESLSNELRAHYTNYEIIIVGNSLAARRADDIKSLLVKLPCIRFVVLSKEHDMDTAVFAGLENAIGDYACVIDPLLDSPKELTELVARNKNSDIVQGISTIDVEGVVGSRIGRKLFYWYNRKFMDIDISPNATYMMSFNRKALNAITASRRDHRHLRHLIRVIGYKLDDYEYEPIAAPSNNRSLKGGAIEALETITSYSTHPLRLVSWVGVFASLINLIYALYVVIVNVASASVAQGWTTTSLQLSIMFFFLFVAITVISEYIGRILSEQRNDQKYFVDDEFASTVSIANLEKKNVTK